MLTVSGACCISTAGLVFLRLMLLRTAYHNTVNLKDSENMRPVDLARENGHSSCVDFIEFAIREKQSRQKAVSSLKGAAFPGQSALTENYQPHPPRSMPKRLLTNRRHLPQQFMGLCARCRYIPLIRSAPRFLLPLFSS